MSPGCVNGDENPFCLQWCYATLLPGSQKVRRGSDSFITLDLAQILRVPGRIWRWPYEDP